MPIQALKQTSTAINGVGAFIHQCTRLDFHYCDWAGSSKGMNLFLTYDLSALAKRSPTITMHVSPRPHRHPIIKAHYVNGATKAICVKNLEKQQIMQKAEILRDASGIKNRRITGGKNVKSMNESVRGIWSGMHDAMDGKDVWKAPKKRSKAYIQ